MKVELKDLKPNPFRDFENYPINEEKVKNLETSIRDTGHWDKLVVRKNGDGFELVYGHHRLQALISLQGEDGEVDVIVNDYNDDDMIRIMSHENDPAYNSTPAQVDEAVKAARDFLHNNPDAAREVLSSEGSEVKRVREGAPMISKFLGGNFNQTKVQDSLARLKLIEEGVINPEAIYLFPTASSANNFANQVKECKVDVDDQLIIAGELAKSKTYGERSICEAVGAFQYFRSHVTEDDSSNSQGAADYCDRLLIRSTRSINKAIKTLIRFIYNMEHPTPTIFSGVLSMDDVSPNTIRSFNESVDKLSKRLKDVQEAIKKGSERGRQD